MVQGYYLDFQLSTSLHPPSLPIPTPCGVLTNYKRVPITAKLANIISPDREALDWFDIDWGFYKLKVQKRVLKLEIYWHYFAVLIITRFVPLWVILLPGMTVSQLAFNPTNYFIAFTPLDL